MRFTTILLSICGCLVSSLLAVDENVGPLAAGGHLTATHQLLHPAGQSLEFNGRPVDLAISPNGRTLYVKDNRGFQVIDVTTWNLVQTLAFNGGGGSVHGLVLTRDGSRLYATTAQDILWEAKVTADGKLELSRKLTFSGTVGGKEPDLAGLALSPDEKTVIICLSRNNSLGVVELESGKLLQEVPVGVAPYDVVLFADGKKAFVSNWGGRHPRAGERTAKSSGTEALVDERGVATSGTVSVVDLEQGREITQITVGLHPTDLELSGDQRHLYVANANSDSVSVIDVEGARVVETIEVRPDAKLAFGSAPNALSLSKDDKTLFVANGGNNAVVVVSLAQKMGVKSRVEGFIPTAWFPGAVANDGRRLYVANVKGLGSRNLQKDKKGWNSHFYLGTVGKVEVPDTTALRTYTRTVKADARVPEMLRAWVKSHSRAKPVPVPKRLGEPSVFEHVVYIIKENRTYDQVLGDLPRGNADPELCMFGREVTPNHHALAEEFALLDNYYCNGVCSADGHAWAMEGFATDYLEKSFGGWSRSYPFSGDDPLSFAPTGFIWDHVLLHGLSFRNYGEMSKTEPQPRDAKFLDIYADYKSHSGKISFQHQIWVETLRRYSCPDSPGWQMRVPDAIRADIFLRDFEQYEKSGNWPNLIILYLPSDHTSGTRPGVPTPRAQVADNDLAVGRVVERISHSRFWPTTCIFVNEDDPQAGFDHVDGHRSLCLVVSPYTKRGKVVSKFYNQTSVLHTMSRMFGIPPMNQMVALSPLMTDCFTTKPDLKPYRCLPNQIPLDEMNKPTAMLRGAQLHWARASMEQNFDDVDRADEDTLNRILWHYVKGVDAPYPVQFAGAHGKGLRKLGLKLDGKLDDDN